MCLVSRVLQFLFLCYSILKARLRDNRAVQGGICGEVYGLGEDSEELRRATFRNLGFIYSFLALVSFFSVLSLGSTSYFRTTKTKLLDTTVVVRQAVLVIPFIDVNLVRLVRIGFSDKNSSAGSGF